MLAQTYPDELRAYLKKFPEQLGDFDLIPTEFKAGQPVSPEMEAAFAGADLLVLNSGMTLSFGYYGHDWDRYPTAPAGVHARPRAGRPYGVYGHSFDKLDPPADILYRDVLGTASFVYTRDSELLRLLQSKGVACPEMAFAPDSTFAFDLRNAETHAYADRFLAEHRLERGKFLAFVPRLDVHRFRDDGREQVHAAQTRDLISQWVRRTGEPVVLVPEVWHKTKLFDIPADAPKTMVLRPAARRRAPVRALMPDYWMPDEAQAVYARARLVVSAEMHSVILGLAAGVPAVHPHFAQAGLKQWMLRDLGIEEWLFDQDVVPVERIADAIVAVREHPEQARRWWTARRRRSAGARTRPWTWCIRRCWATTPAAWRRPRAPPRPRRPARHNAEHDPDSAAGVGRRGRAAGGLHPARRLQGGRPAALRAGVRRAAGVQPDGRARGGEAAEPEGAGAQQRGAGPLRRGGSSDAVAASIDTLLHLGGTVGDVMEMRHIMGTAAAAPPATRHPCRPGRAAYPAGRDAVRLPGAERPPPGQGQSSTWRWRGPPTTPSWRR